MYHKLICTGLSPSMIAFSKTFHFVYYYNIAVLLPHKCRNNRGLGCSPVARHYWGNHCCFMFLQVLRCFSSFITTISQSYYPTNAETIVVWAVPRSLATTGGITVVLCSYRYLDVSVPCVCIPEGIIHLQCIGLPHSEICGSRVICTYPQLIAAYHVLHRL